MWGCLAAVRLTHVPEGAEGLHACQQMVMHLPMCPAQQGL